MQFTINFNTIHPYWLVAFGCYFFFYMTIKFMNIDIEHLINSLDYLNECDYNDDVKDEVPPPIKKTKYEEKYLKEYRSLINKFNYSLTDEQINNLKNNFILEKTPLGCAVMCFNYNSDNIETSSFIYYSDHSMPYNYLDTLARKYVLTFNCLNLYIDIQKERETPLKTQLTDEPIKPKLVEQTKELEKNKSVFANLKSYNKESVKVKIQSSNPEIKTSTKEIKINRYTSGGKLSNFNFIKKIDKKLVNKNYSLSFVEFKKMKNKNI